MYLLLPGIGLLTLAPYCYPNGGLNTRLALLAAPRIGRIAVGTLAVFSSGWTCPRPLGSTAGACLTKNILNIVRQAALKQAAQKQARRVAVQAANKQYGAQHIN